MLNRFLGGVSHRAMFAPEGAAGGGGGGDGGSGGGAAGGGDAGGAAGAAASGGAGGASAGGGGAAGGSGAGGGAAGSGAGGAAGAQAGQSLAGGAADAAAASRAGAAAPADYPADWRERVAGDDKAYLNTLKRYGSVPDALKALRELQLRVSAGELRAPVKPPAADATPEQVAAWRKDQGLPDKAADYVTNLKLANGVVPGEADKPLLDAVAEMAHKGNYPQQTVNDFVGLYYSLQDQLAGQREETDADFKVASLESAMAAEGADFRRNSAGLESFWREQPKGISDLVLGARTPDGHVLGEMPEVRSWVVGLMRDLNPAATILPPGTDGSAASVQTRMQQIEAMMYVDGKPNPAYFGTAVEKEYRDLIDAQQRMQSRAA